MVTGDEVHNTGDPLDVVRTDGPPGSSDEEELNVANVSFYTSQGDRNDSKCYLGRFPPPTTPISCRQHVPPTLSLGEEFRHRLTVRCSTLFKMCSEFGGALEGRGLRLGVTLKSVTLGNVTMSHRTREPAECLRLSHSTMIGLRAQH
ncbi:hypothetical protein EVAR_68289_1 [Eumeta japonica]|uniref:Uncharacterized protein n=1 Tax=Eumeta variegata TaxID=151549 RepID=A0A4C2A1B9_EUMVA|nr:hypothetical protein EVAR_68289_1 [Eumeta japonica]